MAIGIAWAVCAVGWIVVLRAPDSFESSARIYMNADAVLSPLLNGITVGNYVNRRIDVIQRTLLSAANVKKLIRITDLDLRMRNQADRDRTVQRLQREIVVKPQTQNLFTISYSDADPALAQSIVSNAVALFIESGVSGTQLDSQSALRFLQAEIDRLELRLREDERRKAEFQSRYGDLLPSLANGQSRLDEARLEVTRISAALADAIATRDALMKQRRELPAIAPAAGGTTASAKPNVRLEELRMELNHARATMTDQHPVVTALKRQIASLTGKLNESPQPDAAAQAQAASMHPLHGGLSIQVSAKDTAIASLRRRLVTAEETRDRLNEQVLRAPTVQADYADLNRDYDVVKSKYDALLQRREAGRLNDNANRRGNLVTVRTIDPPEVPIKPTGPNRPLFLSMVLIGGLAAGVGIAFALGEMDSSFSTTTALQMLGLPILGSITRIEGLEPQRTARLNGVTAFAAACAALVLLYGGLAAFQFLSTPSGM